ncbi:hypothetical protein RJT34_02202 [Clitoria ternatea]|uniref:Uncharacterized protein n=1 Tax=Clitoria ternatea TaxID=43366 RepID=A0AAN9Q0U1_CLITE
MAQKDKTMKRSRNGGGGTRVVGTKRPKQRKVPQRGLGVAQLEKIRLEEELKMRAAIATTAIAPPYNFPQPYPNFIHSNQPSSPISMPLCIMSGGFKPQQYGLPVIQNTSMPQSWSSNFDLQNKSMGMDLGLRSVSSFCCEPNPIRSFPNWANRTQYLQHPSSSMVTISTGTSKVLHSTIEHLSKQNYNGCHAPMKAEEMMIGNKRSNPFSLDVPPMSSFNFKPPTFGVPIQRNEAISSKNESGFNMDVGNLSFKLVQLKLINIAL